MVSACATALFAQWLSRVLGALAVHELQPIGSVESYRLVSPRSVRARQTVLVDDAAVGQTFALCGQLALPSGPTVMAGRDVEEGLAVAWLPQKCMTPA